MKITKRRVLGCLLLSPIPLAVLATAIKDFGWWAPLAFVVFWVVVVVLTTMILKGITFLIED